MKKLNALYHALPVILIGLVLGVPNFLWLQLVGALDVVAPRAGLRAALAYLAFNKAVYRVLVSGLVPELWEQRKVQIEAGEATLRAALGE